jgi:hypothetical protein
MSSMAPTAGCAAASRLTWRFWSISRPISLPQTSLLRTTLPLFHSGDGYRITRTQQIDFHIGAGLNDNAPAYIVGIGYSFRLDSLF